MFYDNISRYLWSSDLIQDQCPQVRGKPGKARKGSDVSMPNKCRNERNICMVNPGQVPVWSIISHVNGCNTVVVKHLRL